MEGSWKLLAGYKPKVLEKPFLPSGPLAVPEITLVTKSYWKGKRRSILRKDQRVGWVQLIQRKGLSPKD